MKIPKARKLPSGTWHIQLRLGGESITVNARTEKECVRQAQIIKAEIWPANVPPRWTPPSSPPCGKPLTPTLKKL